jgi:hypothetical protein
LQNPKFSPQQPQGASGEAMTKETKEELGPMMYLIGPYMMIGMLFSLVKLFSGRVWLFMYDTRPWYQRIWGDVEPLSLVLSIFTWPRYVYILITQGQDAFLRDLFTVWY